MSFDTFLDNGVISKLEPNKIKQSRKPPQGWLILIVNLTLTETT